MAPLNYIQKVAIVGAGGNLGKHFTAELLKTGKHTVTALTRPGSKSTLPPGVKTVQVAYDGDSDESLVSALQGQQFLIITLPVTAAPGTHSKIVNAAVKAGLPYIMPNCYGFDVFNENIRAESVSAVQGYKNCNKVVEAGASYIAMVCGFWYEWSLVLGPQWFGFDIKNKTVTFYDDGKTLTNISTWEQCGRAVAGLLSLPESGSSPSISEWKNKPVYIDSFRVSQRDMLDSIHRVTGTTDSDWNISYESSEKRYKDGVEETKAGVQWGFVKAMYARVFYPDGSGNFEDSKGLANDVLGLKKEDLDEATKRAVAMMESGWNPFA